MDKSVTQHIYSQKSVFKHKMRNSRKKKIWETNEDNSVTNNGPPTLVEPGWLGSALIIE